MNGVMWVNVRQYRLSLLLWGAVVLAFALFVLISGLRAWDEVARDQLADCFGISAAAARCGAVFTDFAQSFNRTDRLVYPPLLVLPVLLGVFGATPLAAGDLENLTYKFIWTQAVTPKRWLATKIALMSAVALASGIVLAAAAWPWLQLTERMGLAWNRFAEFPASLLAYFVFACAVGLAAGVVLGRAIPAAIAAFAVIVSFRTAVELWLRQTLIPPLARDNLLARPAPDDWFIGLRYYDAAGREVPLTIIRNIQLSSADPSSVMAEQGIRVVGLYQPWERFWSLQAIESLIFAVLALLILGGLYWWVDRARS